MTAVAYVRPPAPRDREAFLAAVARSRRLHRCRTDTGEPAGVINLTNIVLGVFRSGYLGYYAFAGHERNGYMRACGFKKVGGRWRDHERWAILAS